MRLIDADAFLKHEIERCDGEMPYVGTCSTTNFTLKSELEKMIVIDAVPVRHGHWTEEEDCCVKCSVCGSVEIGRTNYCFWCGAKMF